MGAFDNRGAKIIEFLHINRLYVYVHFHTFQHIYLYNYIILWLIKKKPSKKTKILNI